MLERELLAADVVYDGLGMPRLNAAALIERSGRLLSVGELATLRQSFPEVPVRRVGFALSPPLVNAHTHLDAPHDPPADDPPAGARAYAALIARLSGRERGVRREIEAEIDAEVEALRRSGVGVVGDVVRDEKVMRRLLASDLAGVAYWEVVGPHPDDAERLFEETVAQLRAFKGLERAGGMRLGLAPHAPHTVSAPLLQKLAALARANDLPLKLQVSESPEEVAYHRSGGVWLELQALAGGWRPSGLSPVRYLERLGVLDARPTLVQMIYVDEEDVRAVQRAGCAVVHCPRANAALGRDRFPWELYAKHGVTVAFGTDVPSFSPSRSVAEEVAFARSLHGSRSSLQALVWSATKGGYRALGMTPPKVLRGADVAELQAWG